LFRTVVVRSMTLVELAAMVAAMLMAGVAAF
jgi:hypothetical protein